MAYRSFRDAEGTEWQAWDVTSQLFERRLAERRQRADASPSAQERRARAERRTRAAGRAALAGLEQGWLCFETPREKRRLTPIPADWTRCDESRLRQYCREAIPARRARKASDVVSQGDLALLRREPDSAVEEAMT